MFISLSIQRVFLSSNGIRLHLSRPFKTFQSCSSWVKLCQKKTKKEILCWDLFVINCNIRLHNCDTIEKVIDELNTNLDVTESIRYFKNKNLLFGFYYNF